MGHNNTNCTCDSCQQRMKLEEKYPNKEIGTQYAVWDLEKFRLIVSAEELPYLQGELNDKPIKMLNDEGSKYVLAYGIFNSQTDFHQNFYDLNMSKNSSYFYFDDTKEQCFEVEICDYKILAKNKNAAKVCLLVKVEEDLPFPKYQDELSITLNRTMLDLGKNLKDLVFSRIEYGYFRLDSGKTIEKSKIGHWKKQISSKRCFEIPFNKFMIIDPDVS